MNAEISAPIEALWLPQGLGLKKKQRLALPDLRVWLQKQGGRVADVLTRDPSQGWEGPDMRKLERNILDSPPDGHSGLNAIACLYAVAQRWRIQNKQSCPLPRKVWATKRPCNPLRFDPAESIGAHQLVREDLIKAVERIDGHLSPWIEKRRAPSISITSALQVGPDYLALGLASGIIHLGILHADSVVATISALAKPESGFLAINKWVAIAHSLPVRGIPDSEHRIWIPDPLTATLLLNVQPKEAQTLLDNALSPGGSPKTIRARLLSEVSERIGRALGASKGRRRSYSIPSLLRPCVKVAPYWLPFCVVAYLTRRFVSHSLRPGVIERFEPATQLLSDQYQADGVTSIDLLSDFEPSDEKDQKESEEDPAQEPTLSIEVSEEPIWAPAFSQAMSSRKVGTVRRRLTELAERDMPVIAVRLANFGAMLARPRGAKTIRPGSLRKYMSLLIRFLAPQIGDDDPMTQAGGEDEYVEAIEDHKNSTAGQSLSSQRLFSLLLLRFHSFLVERHGAKPLEDIHGFVAGCLPVDANILTVEDLRLVLAAIGESPLIPEDQRLHTQLIVVLGYVGLRRNEAYYLRACDIEQRAPFYLSLRNTRERKLKTRNATRRASLGAILPRPVVERFVKLCRDLGVDVLSGLFQPTKPGFLDEDALFAAIHRIMRETLKDPKVRFHSLRHSAATLLTLGLLAGKSRMLGELFPNLRKTRGYLYRSDRLRKGLYGSRLVHWSDLHFAANIIGHGSGRTTLTYYCHSMFLIAAACTMDRENLTRYKVKAIIRNASAVPKTTAYNKIPDELAGLPLYLFNERFRDIIKSRAAREKQRAENESSVSIKPGSNIFEQSMAAVELLMDPAVPVRRVMEQSGVDEETVEEIVDLLTHPEDLKKD